MSSEAPFDTGGSPFVDVDAETADHAVREFNENNEDDLKTRVRPKLGKPFHSDETGIQPNYDARSNEQGSQFDEDDFDIAVDEEDFSRGDPTKPLDSLQLEELLAACKPGTPTPPTPLEVVSHSLSRNELALEKDASAGAGTCTSSETGLPAVPTSAWLPSVGNHLPSLLAIDFGTSYSSVAVVLNQRTHVLPLTATGLHLLPSLVGIDANGHALVGEQARQMLIEEPANVISSPKRLLGRPFNNSEVEPHLAQMAMNSSAGPTGDILLHARGRIYTIEQLCAPLLH